MKNGKKVALISLVTGVAGSAVIGATAMAATSSSSTYPDIVQKIADRFHLNPSDVNSVFQQERTDRQANRHQKLVLMLDQAVSSGKITKDQETKILAELDNLQQQFKNESKQDRRSNHQTMQTQLQQWLKDNNINVNLDNLLPHPSGPKGSPTADRQS
jgi:hypothetical protein